MNAPTGFPNTFFLPTVAPHSAPLRFFFTRTCPVTPAIMRKDLVYHPSPPAVSSLIDVTRGTLTLKQEGKHAQQGQCAACCTSFYLPWLNCAMVDMTPWRNTNEMKCNGQTLAVSSAQITLEPAVIQDVLSAGSHLQLLELLNLCSHYLIQVGPRARTHTGHFLFALMVIYSHHDDK